MASDADMVREVTRRQRIRDYAVRVVEAYGFSSAEAGRRAIDLYDAMVEGREVDWEELRELAHESRMRDRFGQLYDEYLRMTRDDLAGP